MDKFRKFAKYWIIRLDSLALYISLFRNCASVRNFLAALSKLLRRITSFWIRVPRRGNVTLIVSQRVEAWNQFQSSFSRSWTKTVRVIERRSIEPEWKREQNSRGSSIIPICYLYIFLKTGPRKGGRFSFERFWFSQIIEFQPLAWWIFSRNVSFEGY